MDKVLIKRTSVVNIIEIIRKRSSLFTLLAVILFGTAVSKGLFLSVDNVLNVSERASIVGIIAVGQMFVILTGGIDLSIGSIMAMCFTSLGFLSTTPDMPIPVAILATLLVGLVIGAVNGLIVSRTNVPAFIITLSTMLFFQYLSLLLTGSKQLDYVNVSAYINETFRLTDSSSRLLPTIVWILVTLAGGFILNKTRFGKNVYAVGGSEKASRLSGISTNSVKMNVYTICGFLCAVASIIYAFRLKMANPDAGMKLQLESVAAVIVGGTNIAGGEGSIVGTFIGAIILSTLVNILNLINVDPYIQDAIKGLLLVVFVYILQLLSKKGSK